MTYSAFFLSVIAYLILYGLRFYYTCFDIETVPKHPSEPFKNNSFQTVLVSWFRHFVNWKYSACVISTLAFKWKVTYINGLAKFAGIFCCISLVFCSLQYWADHSINSAATNSNILLIEATQHQLKDYAAKLQIVSNLITLILILLIVLILVFSIIERSRLNDKYYRYHKLVNTITYILITTTSFTFFSYTFGKDQQHMIAELEKHKLDIISENKLFVNKLKKEVQRKVIDQLLNQPLIAALLEKHAKIYKLEQSVISGSIYTHFAAITDKSQLGKLSVFNTAHHQPAENGSAYNDRLGTVVEADAQSNDKFSNGFKMRNKAWYHEHMLSKKGTKIEEDMFDVVCQEKTRRSSKLFDTYGEVLEEVVKAGYDKRGKKIIHMIYIVLGQDFVFFEKVSDPIIHEPIEEFINKTTDKLMKDFMTGNTQKAKQEWCNIGAEVQGKFVPAIASSVQLKEVQKQLSVEMIAAGRLERVTEVQIARVNDDATSFVETAASKTRWENIRRSFADRSYNSSKPGEFSKEQLSEMKTVLSDWKQYIKVHSLSWYCTGTLDLEQQFFIYSKDKPIVKAVWGFILQQQDWNAAAHYFTNVAYENATGKPYYFLKYYYNSTNHRGEVNSLYDRSTDAAVEKICPEIH